MKIQRGRYFTSFFSFLLCTSFYAVATTQRRSASLLTFSLKPPPFNEIGTCRAGSEKRKGMRITLMLGKSKQKRIP